MASMEAEMMHVVDEGSDSELEHGLPPPRFEGDPEVWDDENSMSTTTAFCNELRQQAMSMLAVSDWAMAMNQAKEDEAIKGKESKAKKRLVRGGRQEPLNGVIERRYGYIPNPRWPKQYSQPMSRSFEPRGVRENARDEVCGVMYRKSGQSKGKGNSRTIEHSYQEKEFPELSGHPSAGDVSYSDTSAVSANSSRYVSAIDSSLHSPSPITSTPVRQKTNHMTKSSQQSSLSFVSDNDSSVSFNGSHQGESVEPGIINVRRVKVTEPRSWSQNLSAQSSQGEFENSPWTERRESRKQSRAESPGTDRLQVTHSTQQNTMPISPLAGGQDTWSRVVTRPHSPGAGSNAWSMVRQSSPTPQDSRAQVRDRLKSPLVLEVGKEGGFQNNGRPSPSLRVVGQSNYSNPASPTAGSEQDTNCQSGKPNKGSRGKGRRSGGSDQRSQQPQQANSSGRNSKRNSGGKPRPMTLDSFLKLDQSGGISTSTPRHKKDLGKFENRFVSQIEASATSPPKKVQPSPIKRLSFSKRETEELPSPPQHTVTPLGDASSHELVKSMENLELMKSDLEMSRFSDKGRENGGKRRSVRLMFGNVECEPKDVYVDCEEEKEHPDSLQRHSLEKAEHFFDKKPLKPSQIASMTSEGNGQPESTSSAVTSPSDVTSQELPTSAASTSLPVRAEVCKVTDKLRLKRLAQQYCYMLDEHYVANLSLELYFVIQLLTSTQVEDERMRQLEKQGVDSVLCSVHNCVYFAVMVIKRMRRLLTCLDTTFLRLLADNPRVQQFSPKLHQFFLQAVEARVEGVLRSSQVDHSPYNVDSQGTTSFPDTNYAHVFKSQRDNFYAFYRHYHDTTTTYECQMDTHIQYVFDGCTPEQNSTINLLHLAQLFLNHFILCCVQQPEEKVDILEMLRCKLTNPDRFQSLYSAFLELTSPSTPCPAPGFSRRQMFFKDFIDTLSSPAFNELLKNLVVAKILELNSTSFSSVCNLHSAQLVPDNQTPLRCEKFTDTVLTLNVLGKLLGYLTFSPYSNGAQNLPPEQSTRLLAMREMTPLPLPLPFLLRQSFEQGHLSVTVPWIVEYLAMIDGLAPQLAVYKGLLKSLHYIHRYAWQSLYLQGHHSTGLLITACISWLFESPSLPSGYFYSERSTNVTWAKPTDHFQIDHQKLVSHTLLSSCCPYLEQGQVLLTQFALESSVSRPIDRPVHPIPPEPQQAGHLSVRQASTNQDLREITAWLGHSEVKPMSDSVTKKTSKVVDDEVVPSYVLTRLLSCKLEHNSEDLLSSMLHRDPWVKTTVDTAVTLTAAKVEHFALHTILKVLMFEAKVNIRQKFREMDQAEDAELVKSEVLSQSLTMATNYNKNAWKTLQEVTERVCAGELSQLVHFLASHMEPELQEVIVQLAKRFLVQHIDQWARVQMYPAVFQRVIEREAERCSYGNPRHLSLYPSEYGKRPNLASPTLNPGFDRFEQLSDLIDRALSIGVWYVNALSPGVRPDDKQLESLIKDFASCIEKNMITMDFAFNVMSNFLMHLIVQYMVEAPHNWTDACQESFLTLCKLCVSRQRDQDNTTTEPQGQRKRSIKVKVSNFLSVFAVQWLLKSQIQNATLMAYTQLLCALITSDLLQVETVIRQLMQTKGSRHVQDKAAVDKVIVKLLQLLYVGDKGERREKEETENDGQKEGGEETELDRQKKREEIEGGGVLGGPIDGWIVRGGCEGEGRIDQSRVVSQVKELIASTSGTAQGSEGSNLTQDLQFVFGPVLGN